MYSTRSPNYYENVAQATTVTTKMGRGSGRMDIGCTKTGIFQREEQNEGSIQAPHNRRLSSGVKQALLVSKYEPG